MNILILTPIHPVNILDMAPIYNKYENQDVFSLQTISLVYDKWKYVPANFILAQELIKRPNIIKTKNKNYKNLIVFGNLDKRTKIKFDHIVAFNNDVEAEVFDPYLEEGIEQMSQAKEFSDDKKVFPTIKWYKQEDAEYTFPTLEHLFLFLSTLGIKGVDNEVKQ